MATIPVRRGPRGLEALVNSTWHPVNQAWVDARRADGHDVQMEGQQADSVQGGVNPHAFAADGARLDAAGSILSQPPRQAVATQQTPDPKVFAPDGARLSPEGSILPLPGTAQAAAPPPGQHVDPGANWDYSGRPPQTSAAAAPPRQREALDGSLLPLPQGGTMDGIPVQGDPAKLASVQAWYERLMQGVQPGPQYMAYGGRIANYATGGEVPNAIVGEGMEGQADTGADNEFALEAVWVPTGQPGTFKGYWAEGPVTATLDPGTLIHPIAKKHEQLFRDELLPITAMKQAKKPGSGGAVGAEGSALPLPPDPAEYAYGGRVPEPPPMVNQPSLVPQAALSAAPNQQKPMGPYERGW